MKVIFIRHGMTDGNKKRKYIGITDEGLCREGRELLENKNYDLDCKVDFLFVSPMKRCIETAEIIFPGTEYRVIDKLAEMDFGKFENRAFSGDLEHDPEYKVWLDSMCEGPVPGGEQKADFVKRSVEGFQEALEIMKRSEEGFQEATVAFVLHGGSIMSIMSEYGKSERAYYEWSVNNGQGYMCNWNGKDMTGIEKIE